jgi:hypothetical protein
LFSQDGRETKRDNTTALTEFVKNLEAVIKLSPELLPPSADMLLGDVLYRAHGTSCGEELRQLKNHAIRLRAACLMALNKIELTEAQTGRQKNRRADELFVQVVDKLKCELIEDRLNHGAVILTLCKVKTPETEDIDSLKRHYDRAKKALKPPSDKTTPI